MFCARLVCEWPLIARADTQTLAVINVCLFSHILCGRLSIFYAGCDPALFFSVPAPWCPVPVSFASGRITVSDDKGTTKKRNGVLFRSSPFCSFRIFSFFSFCVAQSMSMQYFSQRYLTATGGSILVDGDTPICRSASWSESNHLRKVGSDTPAACANSDLSFDLYFSIGYICYHYTQKKGRY